MPLLLTAMILPITVGFLFLKSIWPGQGHAGSLFGVKVCLSVGAGMGASSLIFVTWLWVFGAVNRMFVVSELTLFITLMAVLLYHGKKKQGRAPEIQPTPGMSRIWSLCLRWGFYLVFAFSIVVFSLITLTRPHGGSDAWTIWNAMARLLIGGCKNWTQAFSYLSPLTHADYPMLLSGSIARIWGYSGDASTAAPALVAITYTLATVGLLIGALKHFQGKLHGYLAGLALLALPGFIKVGAAQIADVPLGFYMLSTIVLFCWSDHTTSERLYIIFGAGLMAGFSAWTKNEGLLFVAAIFLSRFMIRSREEGTTNLLKDISAFTTGLLPALFLIVYFKTQIAPPNDMVAAQGFGITLGRLADPARHLVIARAFVAELYSLGKLRWLIFPICLLLLGLSKDQRLKPNVQTGTRMVLLMLAGYYFVYLITPYELVWHLTSSLQRLYIQLYPSVLFIFFTAINGSQKIGSHPEPQWMPS